MFSWNLIFKTGSALVMYVALVGGVIAGLSYMTYALYAAAVLALGIYLLSDEFWDGCSDKFSALFASKGNILSSEESHAGLSSERSLELNAEFNKQAQAIVPSLAETMTELHELQQNINDLQAQFTAHRNESQTQANNQRGSASS